MNNETLLETIEKFEKILYQECSPSVELRAQLHVLKAVANFFSMALLDLAREREEALDQKAAEVQEATKVKVWDN